MKSDLILKLGIKPGNKVCMVRPNQDTLSQIVGTGTKIEAVVDRIEPNCDVVLDWVEATEDIRKSMLDLQDKIKQDGKIWLIIPKREVARKKNLDIDWGQMQREVLQTRLVDNKVASINDEEYGTQFVIRKEFRKKPK